MRPLGVVNDQSIMTRKRHLVLLALAAVLVLSLVMSALSAVIAARILRRANPADLF